MLVKTVTSIPPREEGAIKEISKKLSDGYICRIEGNDDNRKGTDGAIFKYPSKRDVWGLYRNWSSGWNEEDMVMVNNENTIIHRFLLLCMRPLATDMFFNICPFIYENFSSDY